MQQYITNLIKINLEKLNIEIPNFYVTQITAKVPGHYFSNILFLLRNNQTLKDQLSEQLKSDKYIKKIDIIKGYINFTLTGELFIKKIDELLVGNILPDIGKKKKTNVEYCSVNPTGFLHIGHARNAILGDTIARILKKTNFDVTTEYYVNDGGNQMQIMAESIYAKYCQIHEIEHKFPDNGYQGEEMLTIAKLLKNSPTIESIKSTALKFFLKHIKKDLQSINVNQDVWTYESQIIKEQFIEKALKIFQEKNVIEYNIRTDKHVNKGSISTNQLMLLKTTNFGDDLDRPLTKDDGSWTYFAPDIGYHLNKIEREFDYLICVFGADHDSYANRLKIATHLLKPEIEHKIITCQMVSFENEGSCVKFSKRIGNSIRIKDFIKEIPADILRFMMVEKSADTQFIFNYENAINITMQNPLFYCQYAFARACSITRNLTIYQSQHVENNSLSKYDNLNEKIDFFDHEEVQNFIIIMQLFEQILAESAKELAPHKLANYTKKLCEKMHKIWQIGKENQEYRIIIPNNLKETNNRLKIIKTFIKIAKECFECLGISAPEKL